MQDGIRRKICVGYVQSRAGTSTWEKTATHVEPTHIVANPTCLSSPWSVAGQLEITDPHEGGHSLCVIASQVKRPSSSFVPSG